MKGLLTFLIGIAMGLASHAQEYPVRPVRIVVAYPPGGNTDIVARLMADHFSRAWGKPVLVENRAGAGGTVGTDHVAKSAPDGYTILLAALATNATAPAVYARLPYDPVTDFAYIAPLTFTPNVLLVNSKLPVNSMKDLIAHVRANHGKFNYSSPGVGLSNHLAMELLLKAANIDALHVPYKGSAQATTAVIAGEVQMTLDPVSSSLQHVRAGTLKALGVSARTRSPLLPNVPTFAEAGIADVEAYTWTGLAVPATTPAEIVARLHRDTVAILGLPEMRERLSAMGSDPVDMNPQQFQVFIRNEARKWGDIARRVGARVE